MTGGASQKDGLGALREHAASELFRIPLGPSIPDRHRRQMVLRNGHQLAILVQGLEIRWVARPPPSPGAWGADGARRLCMSRRPIHLQR
jgi:hypothetical protein